MKNYPFFCKLITVLLPVILFSGEAIYAQAGLEDHSEIDDALERLDHVFSSSENKMRYFAPDEEANIEVVFALEDLEMFFAQSENEMIYKAPQNSDELFDFFKTGEGLNPQKEYLTLLPEIKRWLKAF